MSSGIEADVAESERALVDTSAWIEYLRATGSPVAARVERLLLAGRAVWCDMVILELWNGARAGKEQRALVKLATVVEPVATDAETWRVAHRLARCCRGAGVTVPATDILIAACAEQRALGVVHQDGDFDAIGAARAASKDA